MAEFVFGLGSREMSRYIIEKMRAATDSGRRVVLIVPEQQALLWDRRCAKELSPSAALLTETVSFTRLADNVFRRFGGSAKNYITDAKKTLIMWNAVVSVSPSLKVFGRLDREDRYVPLLLSAVREMKLYSVTPESLQEAADAIGLTGENSATADKLRDIALIYTAYNVMLHSCYDDPEEIPDALCRILSENDYFSDAAVFIDSFYTLTPKEMNIVGEIFRRTGDVTVTFPVQKSSAENASDEPHTGHIREYARALARLAAQQGREVTVCEKNDSFTLEGEVLSRGLWDYSAAACPGVCGNIKIITCGDRYDEARLAAARVIDLAASGASFGDIAVCAASADYLSGIADTAFDEAGIPVYMAEKNTVTAYPAVRLLLSAAAVCAGGWRREDVIACAKTGLCGLSDDSCDAFEKYTDKWRIRGKKLFCREDGWTMNPDGYTEETGEWGRLMLSLANQARDTIVPPLEAFSECFGGTARDAAAAAFKLLCDFDVYNRLENEAARLEAMGRAADAQKTRQVWDAICEILDTVAAVIPDAKIDAPRFAALLRRTADTCRIGAIPDGVCRVEMGGAGMIRQSGKKHVIILGAVSGGFPAVPSDNGFFSESDKKLLSVRGINLSPGVDQRQSEELFRFYSAVCAPSETLTVFVPTEGGSLPSAGVTRILKLLPDTEQYDMTGTASSEALWNWAGLREDFAAGRPFAVRRRLSLTADTDTVSDATADGLFGDVLRVTQSRLESFNDCPFMYYCRYVLNLDEGGTAELSPADVGNFVHRILELFMKETAGAEGFPTEDGAIVSRADRLICEYIASVCPETKNRRLDYLFSRLHRSVLLFARSLNNEFAQAQFRPYGFELRVGFDESLPPAIIELSDGRRSMLMRGIIDRLDILRKDGNIYIRVADYKTGTKKFSLSEVLGGRNVQLLLYLFSVCAAPEGCGFRNQLAPNGEKLLPAGALYFSARPGEASSKTLVDGNEAYDIAISSISRQGIIVDNESVIRAMEPALEGKYIPVKLKKDGNYSAASSVASPDQLKYIEKTLTGVLRESGDRMVSGTACSAPQSHGGRMPCTYCSMKSVCRHTDGVKRGADNVEVTGDE